MQLKNVFINSEIKGCNSHLKYFSSLWAIVLLFPLIYFPLPLLLFGHPWKVELITSLFLGLTLTFILFRPQTYENLIPPSISVIWWIIIPWFLLIFWSVISAFWAVSTLSVFHHTLVWFCYLIFFLFTIQIVSNRKLRIFSIYSLGVIIGIIATICVIEFVLSPQIGEVFGFRYARFAEIHASVLPLFFSFILRLKRKHLFWAILVTTLVWLALLLSLSRGSLLSSLVGLSIFILIRVLTRKSLVEKKRLILAVTGIILIAGLVQIPFFGFNQQNPSTLSRLGTPSDSDPSNSIQKNIRILFNGVGLEMFTNNILIGVGADNFGLRFNEYRAIFSGKIENKAVAEQKEELLPERTHNEYLQILAELGVIGGAVFLWFILGITILGFQTLKKYRFDSTNILTHAAVAGIVAFLCSSLVSSFSFRLMQNGLVFFFLLAILLRNFASKNNQEDTNQIFVSKRINFSLVIIAIILCFSLTVFSVLKASNQFFIYQGERQTDLELSKSSFEKARLLDPANPAADFMLGLQLFRENQFQESSIIFKEAIAKGLNSTNCYSYLTSSQILANDFNNAEKTISEAIKIFPYSVFVRVRYSFILKTLQKENESAEQLEVAKQLNKKQAETWWILMNDGSLAALEKAKTNSDILALDKLNPQAAIYPILMEREILHPEEKTKIELNN